VKTTPSWIQPFQHNTNEGHTDRQTDRQTPTVSYAAICRAEQRTGRNHGFLFI